MEANGGEGVTYGRCSAVWGVITVGWLPGRPAGQSPYGPAPGGAVIAAGPSPLHGQHSKQNGSKSSHSDPPALTLEINCLHHIHLKFSEPHTMSHFGTVQEIVCEFIVVATLFRDDCLTSTE